MKERREGGREREEGRAEHTKPAHRNPRIVYHNINALGVFPLQKPLETLHTPPPTNIHPMVLHRRRPSIPHQRLRRLQQLITLHQHPNGSFSLLLISRAEINE